MQATTILRREKKKAKIGQIAFLVALASLALSNCLWVLQLLGK